MTEPVSLLSEDELAALKALADAATPGPWDCGRDPSHYDAPEITKADGAFYVGVKMEDAAFIAAANPQTILALLAKIKKQESEIERAWKRVEVLECWQQDRLHAEDEIKRLLLYRPSTLPRDDTKYPG